MADNPQKDTVYIDIDDEITAVIDKLKSSKHKIVALVLPKRATVLQSLVNMKLLKRTADTANKHIVLITSEAAIMPLAGAVGLHVAKTLLSKPEVPNAPKEEAPAVSSGDEPLDQNAPVGALAGAPDEDSDDESIEVDNSEEEPKDAGAKKKDAKKPKDKKNKIKIPNFDKFRVKLFIGLAALILLIIGWYFAFMVLPKATVTLRADTSEVDLDTQFTADTNAQKLDIENGVIPAVSKEFKKDDNEKVAATGQKDQGKKASGSVTLKLTNCSSNQVTIPAGTTVSTNNLAYVTQGAVTLQSVEIGGSCQNDSFPNISSKTVAVTAGSAGEQYNVSNGQTFTVSGYSAVSGTNSSAMSGGTTKIVKIVTQGDVDGAKQKILDRANEQIPEELENNLRDEGYYPLDDTFTAGKPGITSVPKVGGEGSEVTVSITPPK